MATKRHEKSQRVILDYFEDSEDAVRNLRQRNLGVGTVRIWRFSRKAREGRKAHLVDKLCRMWHHLVKMRDATSDGLQLLIGQDLPEDVWNRIYSKKDEIDDCSAQQIKSVQSRIEPA